MNSTIRITLAGLACAVVGAVAFAQTPGSAADYSAPVADGQITGPAPSQSHVWMSGHWNSEGGQWKWVAAHWELPPSRSAIWISGHWISSGGNWVWANGAWNIPDASQVQAGPPQPPGVPVPTSQAPYVDGQFQEQYGPGGMARATDQPAVTTDYGPIEYSTPYYSGYAYPGYAWAGDPWLWGFPGVALGFGWGPGFVGFGRGGFGRGGFGRGGFGHGGFGHGGFGHGGFGHGGFGHGGSGHFGH
jgi:hypothetical protein